MKANVNWRNLFMEQNATGGNYLSSVKNALRILNSFTMDEPEKKVTDISTELGLNKSTVSRTLATLASEGFVDKDPETKKYRLGLSILTLSGILNSNIDVYRESQPILNRLVEQTWRDRSYFNFRPIRSRLFAKSRMFSSRTVFNTCR